jgi:hypothetical protein
MKKARFETKSNDPGKVFLIFDKLFPKNNFGLRKKARNCKIYIILFTFFQTTQASEIFKNIAVFESFIVKEKEKLSSIKVNFKIKHSLDM